MSEDRVALSVPHGGSYLLLRFPEEVTHLMAEHIIWQAQPVESGRNILPGQTILLSYSRWSDGEDVVSNACCISFSNLLPADLSKTSARQVPQAPVLPLEAFCLLWNKILYKQLKEKTKYFSLGCTALHRQVTVIQKFSIIFSLCKRKSRDGWCSSCRSSTPARQTFQAYKFIVRLLRDLTLIKCRNLIH